MNQKGQAVIILLLIMVVGLTVGLSIVSRSLLNVKLSSQTEESSRAFTAAEAGVEVALQSNVDTVSDTITDATGGTSSYDCKRTVLGSQSSFPFYKMAKDKVAQLYFKSPATVEESTDRYTGDGIRILWGNGGTAINDSQTPAIEVSLIYKNSTDGTYHIAKFALDPNSTRANSNHFCPPGDPPCAAQPKVSNFKVDGSDSIDTPDGPIPFQFGADIDVREYNSDPYFLQLARVRLLYNSLLSHNVGVKALSTNPLSTPTFPSQGSVIDCLGTRESGVSRRLKVYESYPSVPEVFDYVLFNGSGNSLLGH